MCMQVRKPPLPALTVKLSKYNVDDVALGVCKTGAEEATSDRKSGSAGMPRPISYAVFCLKKKKAAGARRRQPGPLPAGRGGRGARDGGGDTARGCALAHAATGFRLLLACFFIAPTTPPIYTLSLHDALPIYHYQH